MVGMLSSTFKYISLCNLSHTVLSDYRACRIDHFISNSPVRLSISSWRNYTDVQSCGMTEWQMTHNSDIACASWDLNSLAILLFVKQFVQANMKENIKASHCWPFMRRIAGDDIPAHLATKAPLQRSLATGIQWWPVILLHPLWRESNGDQWFHRIPCDRNRMVTSGFSNIIIMQLRNVKLHMTVTQYERHEFSTHCQLYWLFNSSLGQTFCFLCAE